MLLVSAVVESPHQLLVVAGEEWQSVSDLIAHFDKVRNVQISHNFDKAKWTHDAHHFAKAFSLLS